jgi:hypothetical protein
MKAPNLTPIILFLLTVAITACQIDGPGIGASHGPLVAPPASCDNGNPTCNVANDFPGPGDIDPSNSLNLVWSTSENALILTEGSASILDTDDDGVPDPADDCPGPGWRTPCDGDASDDGIYFTLEYDVAGAVTVQSDVQLVASLKTIDAYLLVDSSQKMSMEIATLQSDLTTGTFSDTSECPGAAGTGLIGAIKCLTPGARFGVGEFAEIPLLPHATPYSQTPYHHYLDFTRNLTHLTDAMSSLVVRGNEDSPEATTQALYSILTGQGLGPFVPNRAGCPPGHWGYPCFRDLSLPVIMIFTDSPMYNGPGASASKLYGDPPFDGVLGSSALLPPVRMSPNVLYANDPATAWDLGDLTSTSMTVMGTNKNFTNNATTWNLSACRQCTDPTDVSTCWTDGRDAFVKFSLGATISPFLSGQGTAYPTHNVAVFDATPAGVDCDPGPGGGDYWGRLTPTLAPGEYYLASDAAVPLGVSSSAVRGPYQLRIQTTPSDPSWATADLPVPWTDIEAEFLARHAKIVAVLSESPAQPDMRALAQATGSVDDSGAEYVHIVSSSGAGISEALIDGLELLVNARRDVTLVAEDNLATAAVDESAFLRWVIAKTCPTGAEPSCSGGAGTAVCTDCLNGAQMGFEFELSNAIVSPGYDHQIFDFDMVALAEGTYELTRTPVRVMVAKGGPMYGSGHYENTYDASTVCEMPPDVPDWGTLAWTASMPSDSNVEFIVYTANTLEDLDAATPVSLVPSVGVTSLDVADELQAAGEANNMPYLRIRAIINGSTDEWYTPVFNGFSMEFNCVPFD